ncbi:MAG: DUF1801 domain-containing protein [Acidobacteriota bacterium]|nr:DUF1801 domain-containing protein [Acidobacteriota bacterium]MDQ3419528.1 DUF1801 domain-containing protein [Acidobacteriota bacterium]
MWGTSIVGDGSQHDTDASGREGDWFRIGFSPRKDALTVYITSSFEEDPELMAKLAKFKTGKSCLHVKRLTDIDAKVLKQFDYTLAEGAAPRGGVTKSAGLPGENRVF